MPVLLKPPLFHCYFFHRCPSLLGINIAVSQLGKKDRDLIRKSIESHGGIYSPTLDMDNTMLLILTKAEVSTHSILY